jgi:hypothetical protein
MEQTRSIVVFLICVGLVALCFRRWMLDALIEAINNFRGGPPSPMHPLPADDGALLRRLKLRFRGPA